MAQRLHGHFAWIEKGLHGLLSVPDNTNQKRDTTEARQTARKHRLRENELMATVQSMQRALDRQQKELQSMVPSSKYMQVKMSVTYLLLLRCHHAKRKLVHYRK
jgi:hypothetical protein